MASPPIPNRPNPKPRNSEVVDPLRRSFGANPFPVNSRVNVPSDVSRRNSFGGRDFSEKENETKAPPTPKGSKNFMSPTISAVSKINPSPRKRVLSDKNQLSRSLSDLKVEDTKTHHQGKSCVVSFSDVIDIIGTAEKKPFEQPHDMTVTDFDEHEVHEDEDKGIVYSDPRFRISPRPSVPYTSPEFADREVGPELPPYDPKKNYLSPRPQFLHYKPNPRVEKHLDECKQLEELFISESSSSEEEPVLEDGTNAAVEEETIEESEKCEKQEKKLVEEETENVELLEAESDEELACESNEETSHVGLRPFRFLGWFLALSLGYLLVSATISGPTGLSVLEEAHLYEFHLPKGVKEFAKANSLDELSEKLWTLTESSLVYMDKLLSRVRGRAEEEYAPLQFHNLTYTLEESSVFQPTRVEINEETLQENVRGLEDDSEHELEEESDGEENSEVVSEIEDGDAESHEQAEMTPDTDIELNEALVIEEPEIILPEVNSDAEGIESQEKLGSGSTRKDQEEIEAEPEVIYINQHDVETADIKVHQQKETVLADSESGPVEGLAETSEVIDAENEAETSAMIDGDHPQVRSFNKAIVVLSSTVVVLLAAVAFLFGNKAKPMAASAPETREVNLSHVPVENPIKEKLNFKADEEVDDRTSNSVHRKSSSLSNNKTPKEPPQSLGGNNSKLRRESMASSSASEYSVGSFSYGSFTTYEKIPIKSGDGEEEMITPVRRSSRIRKHHQPSSML